MQIFLLISATPFIFTNSTSEQSYSAWKIEIRVMANIPQNETHWIWSSVGFSCSIKCFSDEINFDLKRMVEGVETYPEMFTQSTWTIFGTRIRKIQNLFQYSVLTAVNPFSIMSNSVFKPKLPPSMHFTQSKINSKATSIPVCFICQIFCHNSNLRLQTPITLFRS